MAVSNIYMTATEISYDTPSNTSYVRFQGFATTSGTSYNNNTKTGDFYIDGVWYCNFQTTLPQYSTKQLFDIYATISHYSDGSRSVSASFSLATGISVGTISASTSLILTTIPRASTVTFDTPFLAGNNFNIYIARYATFAHFLKIHVKNTNNSWVLIKEIYAYTYSGTTINSGFTTSEIEAIFSVLAGRASAEVSVDIYTYSNDTYNNQIGSVYNNVGGTVNSPSASTVSVSNFTIGNVLKIKVGGEQNSAFRYDLSANFLGFSKTIALKVRPDGSMQFTWDTSVDRVALLAKLPTSNSGTVTYTLTTYYNDTVVRSDTTNTSTASVNVITESPVFNNTSISYKDINTTSAITGNDQYIIQNKSIVQIKVNSLAVAGSGTSMKNYTATLNNYSNVKLHSGTSITFDNVTSDKLNVSSNITLTVIAEDNRGNKTSVSKTVLIVPYSAPIISYNALRKNSYEDDTELSMSCTISPLNINGVNKNSIKTTSPTNMKYRYRELPSGSFLTPVSFVSDSTAIFPNYIGRADNTVGSRKNVVLILNKNKSFEIEFYVNDVFGESEHKKVIVNIGVPIMFMDSEKQSIGIGKFPSGTNTFEPNGDVVLNKNLQYTDGTTLANVLTMQTGNTNGHGVILGAGGRTIVAGGDAHNTYIAGNPSETVSSEVLYLLGDNDVVVMTGLQGGYANRKEFKFKSDGSLDIGGKSVPNINDFLNSKTSNGYQKLPNGMILQWGYFSTNGGSVGLWKSNEILFPIVFPNECFCVIPTNDQYASGNLVFSNIAYPKVDRFTIFNKPETANNGGAIWNRYIAIGH
jgi:hypothetical protein